MPIVTKTFRTKLLSGTALMWGTVYGSCSGAHAQCAPDPPGGATVVNCTGSDNNGFSAPGGDHLTVNVHPGDSVNGIPGNPNNAAIAFDANTASKILNNDNGNINGNVTGIGNTGSITITNGGNFNGGITITGTGQNTVNNLAGRNINGAVNIIGAQNAIDNAGTFNQGLILNGTVSNTVLNRSGAQINQTFSITGDGQNTFDNFGIVNNGLTLNGNGTNFITNFAGAPINQNIVSNGSARDTVDNSGLFNNSILLGAGDDVVVNRVGGTVNGTIDLGAGNDQFFMLDGRVNNQVLLGDGDDIAVISGGTITQFVRAGSGDDQLLWTGGNIGGLGMGDGNDFANFRGLTSSNLPPGLRIDGGLGFDRLVWDNVQAGDVSRYVNWELFELTNGSQLTFSSGTLTLGDAGSRTGTLSIDSTSTVFAGGGTSVIVPFDGSALVQVNNAGIIDLTNGPASATDSLTIVGNYFGGGGRLLLQTVLGGDGSPSDRLVISGGTGSGSTIINVTNLGGLGAMTIGAGILVVEAAGGATTTAGAFSLGGIVAAGPFEYLLFRGGVTPGQADSWFL